MEHTSSAPVARLVPTKKAAPVIGFSASWLEHDRQRIKPLIPFVKIGRNVRYRMDDLIAFTERAAA